MDGFTVFPAIDLRGGKVVRLAQGDPSRRTVYGDDPLAWAGRWKDEGADWLHVVNLDGAFGEEAGLNLQAVKRILTLGLKVELGGGMRDEASIRGVLDLGAERIFLGTAAVRDPGLVDRALAIWGPERIAGDIGVRDGQVAVSGWRESTPLTVLELGRRLRDQGIQWCVLTDVRRDGVNAGIALEPAVELQSATGLRVVASGGAKNLDDVRRARRAGLAGIVLGRALYDGKISLRECLSP